MSIVCMILVSTFFVVTPDTVRAPPSDYIYVEIGGVAQIEGYIGAGGAITIPSTLGGLPTGIIGKSAFNSTKGHLITSVIIPDSVTLIDNFAFFGCTLLESVTIGRGVTDIGQFVFQHCSILTSITLLMHDPPAVCDCWLDNTPSALQGHAYPDSNFPPPGDVWVDGKLMMGAYIPLSPTADFTYSPSSPTDLDVIQFTDASTDSDGTIASWSWDFNDAGTSTLKNPTHDYAEDGTYSVTLTVTDDDGLSASISKDVVVSNVPPTADFTFCPTSPTNPNSIQFTDTSTDVDGTITTWSWEFGDGATSSIQNPIHQYTDKGTYTINLRVADDDWASNTGSKDIVVSNVVSNVPPTADFTYSPSSPTDFDVIQFTDASADSDGMIVYWSWNFGDGTNSTSKNPQHKYTTPGQYTVVLEVTDNNGAKKSISKIIIISQSESSNNQPIANFSFYPSTAEINETIQFTDTSIDTDGTITTYLWNFGDGTNSTNKNPQHKYTTNGTYSITLKITDDDGVTDLISKVILVNKDSTDTTGDKGTPGFELVLVLCAIAVAMFLWGKKTTD
jgi:PKD repeat protein